MLIGRDSEVDAVATVVAEQGTVLLAGAAGIGKTSVARAALGVDGTWAEGGALATLAWVPYLVFRRMVGTDVTGESTAVAGSVARALSRRGCSAMLFDDAQWADDASLDVIAELVGRFAIVAAEPMAPIRQRSRLPPARPRAPIRSWCRAERRMERCDR